MTTDTPAVWAERTGPNTYRAQSSTGAQLTVAPEGTPDSFTPSDLFRLALATCNLMSADKVIARRIGDDFTASTAAETTKADGENRYAEAAVEIVLDLSSAQDTDVEALREVIAKAVDRGCTVGRTLDHPVPHTLTITAEE